MANVPVQNNQRMKFKTETEYNMKSIRFLLLTITTMFIIIGILMIVLGISVYTHYHSFDFFYESIKSGRFFTPAVLSVFVGLSLLIVTSFGFFGSLKLSTCMVNTYALLLLKLLIIKFVLVILAFTVSHSAMMRYIHLPTSQYPYDPEIRAEIDALQTGLGCCGGYSYLDYAGLEFTENHNTTTVASEIDGALMVMIVPASCCSVINDVVCVRLRSMGCKEALVNVLVQNSSVLGVLGVSVMFIMLLGIIFALLLARAIRKFKTEKAMIEWRMREQMILARQEYEKKENNGADQTLYIAAPDSSTV